MSIRTELLVISIVLLSFSCGEPNRTTNQIRFDLKTFMDGQLNRLNSAGTGLKKTITTDETRETRLFDAPDWRKEFIPLLDIPFNQSAWDNAFTCDSAINAQETRLIYHPTEVGIPLRELSVRISAHDTSITARLERNNLWFTLHKTLQYSSKNGYSFTVEQHTLLGSSEKTVIEGRFNHTSAR